MSEPSRDRTAGRRGTVADGGRIRAIRLPLSGELANIARLRGSLSRRLVAEVTFPKHLLCMSCRTGFLLSRQKKQKRLWGELAAALPYGEGNLPTPLRYGSTELQQERHSVWEGQAPPVEASPQGEGFPRNHLCFTTTLQKTVCFFVNSTSLSVHR